MYVCVTIFQHCGGICAVSITLVVLIIHYNLAAVWFRLRRLWLRTEPAIAQRLILTNLISSLTRTTWSFLHWLTGQLVTRILFIVYLILFLHSNSHVKGHFPCGFPFIFFCFSWHTLLEHCCINSGSLALQNGCLLPCRQDADIHRLQIDLSCT